MGRGRACDMWRRQTTTGTRLVPVVISCLAFVHPAHAITKKGSILQQEYFDIIAEECCVNSITETRIVGLDILFYGKLARLVQF